MYECIYTYIYPYLLIYTTITSHNSDPPLPTQLEQHSKAVERIERDHRLDLDRLTLTTNTLINKHQEQITSLQADLLTKDKERDELIAKYSYENKQVIEYNESRIIEIYEKEKLDMISAIEEREDIIEQLSVQVNTLLSEQSVLQAQIQPNSIFGLKSTKYDVLIIMTGVVCIGIAMFYMDNNIYENIFDNVMRRINRDYNDNMHNNMNNNNQYNNRHSRQQMDVNDYFLPGVAGPGGAAPGAAGERGARRGGN